MCQKIFKSHLDPGISAISGDTQSRVILSGLVAADELDEQECQG